MQKTFKFAVTVGRSENVALEKLAQTWAVKFGVKYVERGSRGSLGFLLDQERVEALLVATNKGPQVYTAYGTFFFHPSISGKNAVAAVIGNAVAAFALPFQLIVIFYLHDLSPTR